LLPVAPPPPPSSTLFPYTTLFRSGVDRVLPGRPQVCRATNAPSEHAVGDGARRRGADEDRLGTNDERGGSEAAVSVRHRQGDGRSEEHTSELQSRFDLVCRLLLEK